MKKWVVLGVGILALTVIGLDVSDAARHRMRPDMGGMGGGHHGGGHFAGLVKALDLDQSQVEAFRTLHNRLRKDVIRKRAEMAVAEVELEELFGQSPPDFKAAEAKVREIEAARGDIKILHLQAAGELREKLSPEQQKRFDEIAGPRLLKMHFMGGQDRGGHGMGAGKRGQCPMMAQPSLSEEAPAGEGEDDMETGETHH
ncbi:MAG: Spy/CpxP family protein refolding chaperone [Desulfobacterales bacterium]